MWIVEQSKNGGEWSEIWRSDSRDAAIDSARETVRGSIKLTHYVSARTGTGPDVYISAEVETRILHQPTRQYRLIAKGKTPGGWSSSETLHATLDDANRAVAEYQKQYLTGGANECLELRIIEEGKS